MRLHITEAGPREPSRGTIVFIHGFPFDGSVWCRQLADIPAGWRALAPDLRGFGRSPIDATPGEVSSVRGAGSGIARGDEPVLTMARFADDLAELIDEEVGGPVVACGLSMGGYVALSLWRRRPDLLRALVLADTRAEADTDEGRENRRRTAQTVREKGPHAVAAGMLSSLLAAPTLQGDSDITGHVEAMILATPPATLIGALAGMAARRDSTTALHGISVPTLVIVGEHDAITPPDAARAMADTIPDATLTLIPDAGHLACLEQPAAFNATLATFLAKLD